MGLKVISILIPTMNKLPLGVRRYGQYGVHLNRVTESIIVALLPRYAANSLTFSAVGISY